MAKHDPTMSRGVALRRSQWQTLQKLAEQHGCTPGDIVSALLDVHLHHFAPKLGKHLAHLKRPKAAPTG